MRICLNLDASRLLRWHVWLANALAEIPGNEVSRAIAPHRRPLPSGGRLLLELERLVYGFRGDGATDRMEAALLSLPQQAGQADVVIDAARGAACADAALQWSAWRDRRHGGPCERSGTLG
jgi:hypothetical protein